MKASLQLNMSQTLTLTPQLQQAIRLLQLSTLDLQQEIQQALDANPLLELETPEDTQDNTDATEETDASEFDETQWSNLHTAPNKSASFDDMDSNLENFYCTTVNLQDHLLWQLDLTPMSDVDRVIALAIIDAIDNDGILTQTVDELRASLSTTTLPIECDEVEAVRHRIQQFDPIGCGSLNLSDALMVQLQQFPHDKEAIQLAKNIIKNDIELLAQHHYRQLIKQYQTNETELNEALKIIQSLNPHPGSIIHQGVTEYIIPDVSVKKIKGVWRVFLNHETLPKLTINQSYASLIQRADSSADNQFLKSNLQEARWFLKSIQSRQETLLKVATAIVEYQTDFLESGEEGMKPLILNDVAQALDLHESTISRVTTQKFMHTPRGVFELKYFFSSHVNTSAGGECSSTAIRAIIKKCVANENRRKPLSDSKISQLIQAQGIEVARRTVAKYREALGIAPSNERKALEE